MPFGLMLIMVMLMFTFTVINAGKLVKERILLQNAADNAALSIAIMRARAYNRLGFLNKSPAGAAEQDAILSWATSFWGKAVEIAQKQELSSAGLPYGAEGLILISGPVSELYLARAGSGALYRTAGFHNQKVVVEAYKTAAHPSMAKFPFGKGFFLGDIIFPEIRARAAAACYNVKGPMFPDSPAATYADATTEYNNAWDGGWEAHLVRIGGAYAH